MPHRRINKTINTKHTGSATPTVIVTLAKYAQNFALIVEDPAMARVISVIFSWMVVLFLLTIAGIMSGLTLAMFTLDENYLRHLAKRGKEPHRYYATRVLPFILNPNRLLATLVLCNSLAVEALPMVLEPITSPIMAIVFSVFFVLVFGEIVPQAFFAQYALATSAMFAPLLSFLEVITAPITWPLGKAMDYFVGQRGSHLMRRNELKQVLRLHNIQHAQEEEEEKSGSGSDTSEQGISKQEMVTMMGAMSLSETTVGDVLKSKDRQKVFYVERNARVTRSLVMSIFEAGYSRIPVYDSMQKKFVSYFLSKHLISFIYCKEQDAPLVQDLKQYEPLVCREDALLGEVCEDLSDCSTPLVIVLKNDDEDGSSAGLLTAEDINEAIHGVDVVDEFDRPSHPRSAQHAWKERLAHAKRMYVSSNTVSANLGLTARLGDFSASFIRGPSFDPRLNITLNDRVPLLGATSMMTPRSNASRDRN